MKKVFWMTCNGDCLGQWNHFHHYEILVQDITGFTMSEDLCSTTVKYMAKRLSETKYQKRFKSLYTIYENEYYKLVEDFKNHSETYGWIGVQNEKEKVC